MTMKRSWIAVVATLGCLSFAWATGAGRPYPANAGGVIDPSCTSSLPCIEYDNNGTGPGIRGVGLNGQGLVGVTKHKSTSAANGTVGVLGTDASTTGVFNLGVNGFSARGVGVAGGSNSGTGVRGVTTSGVGVSGKSTSSIGVQGVSNISDAVQGVIGSGVASSFHAGVAGLDSSTSGATNEGIYGQSTNGIGIQAVSSRFIGEQVSGGQFFIPIAYPALSINGNGGSDLIDACNSGGPNPCRSDPSQPKPQFTLDGGGNIVITGRIFTSGTCSVGCASSPSSGEKRVRMFTPQESLPTVEDFGQAQLAGGRTYVRIDPAFGNTMDKSEAYLVFITPKGDNRGLYVTNESATGFEVRESQGGRSTLAFDYRIVAKPFGEHPVRLQMITVSRPGTSLPRMR